MKHLAIVVCSLLVGATALTAANLADDAKKAGLKPIPADEATLKKLIEDPKDPNYSRKS